MDEDIFQPTGEQLTYLGLTQFRTIERCFFKKIADSIILNYQDGRWYIENVFDNSSIRKVDIYPRNLIHLESFISSFVKPLEKITKDRSQYDPRVTGVPMDQYRKPPDPIRRNVHMSGEIDES